MVGEVIKRYKHELEKVMNKKVNKPKKGAAKKLAKRLKELSQRTPPKGLVEHLNRDDNFEKQVASSFNDFDL